MDSQSNSKPNDNSSSTEKFATELNRKIFRTKNIKLIPLLIIYIILITGVTLANYSKQNIHQPITTTSTQLDESMDTNISTTFTYNSKDLENKTNLISSSNIDDVMDAIRIGHIPDDKVENRSFSSINTNAFKIDLDINDRYQKLRDYINISEFPSTNNATLNNDFWKGYSYSEASNMYTKNGYACMILDPNRFQATPYMSCANLIDLSKNTLENVSAFMIDTLENSGINCKIETCEITNEQEEFPLNDYGRDFVYFDKDLSVENTNEIVNLINEEAKESAKFLESSGWTVNLEDYTETERKWSDTLISMRISAENHFLQCSHSITVMEIGKRQMVACSYKNTVLEDVQKFYNPYK